MNRRNFFGAALAACASVPAAALPAGPVHMTLANAASVTRGSVNTAFGIGCGPLYRFDPPLDLQSHAVGFAALIPR